WGGLEEVATRVARGEELRMGAVADVVEPAGVQRGAHLLAGSDRDGALHDEHRAPLRPRQLVEHGPDRRQVGVARVRRGRPDAHEEELGILGGVAGIEREAQPLGVPLEQVVDPGLVDRTAAATKRGHFLRTDVADDHLVPQLCETGGGHEAGVAGAEDGDLRRHFRAFIGRSPLAIASIVSLERSFRRSFSTQYVAPFSRRTIWWMWLPVK